MAQFKLARCARQLELPAANTWGGARRGAGRPIKDRRPIVLHRTRPDHDACYPVHVTFRVRRDLPSLRNARPFCVITAAMDASSNEQFRIVQFSVQHDHVHLIAEADDKRSLSHGIAGLRIRAAKALNRTLRRQGAVWSGKYHTRPLRTPTETRAALVYVLQNWKKHIRGASGIDGRSSGFWFDGWKKAAPAPTTPSPVRPARTWLASKGWRERGGGRLDVGEKPADASPHERDSGVSDGD